jgi:hypothetical protein
MLTLQWSNCTSFPRTMHDPASSVHAFEVYKIILTPLALKIPVLRRGAASMPSVVIACADPSMRPAARITDFMAMVCRLMSQHAQHSRFGHEVHFINRRRNSDGGTAPFTQQSSPRRDKSKKAGAKQSFLRLVQLSIEPGLGDR